MDSATCLFTFVLSLQTIPRSFVVATRTQISARLENGQFKHEGALYKGISFASSGSLETGTMYFYASRSNRELISLRVGLGITNRTIISKDIANTSKISVYNPVVNMIP